MADIRLKFSGGELVLGEIVTTLGRTPDNDVSFPDDSNVSRYHAEIELRGGEYCLIDLNSSNGTTVNGAKVTGEAYLKDGDVIVLGGSSEVRFGEAADAEPEAPEAEHDAPANLNLPPVADAVRQVPGVVTTAEPVAGGSRTMLMIAGGAALVAVVVVVAAGAIYYRSTTAACDATAAIVSPEPGDTIYEATEILLAAENTECVAKAIFTLDGQEFASADGPSFAATLDPDEHPDLSDGSLHDLGIILVDDEGKRIPQPGAVSVVMETRKVEKPEDRPEEQLPQQPVGPTGTKGKEITVIQVHEMTNRFVTQFSGNHRYNVSDKQFLQEVQKKAAEFAREGNFERAAKYRDSVNVAFVKENNLDAPLGYILAMSRSNFNPQRQGPEEGLWRMDDAFVKANAYDGTCGGQQISEPSQLCAARAAAVHMKTLVHNVFDGDVIYATAAFGKSPADAAAWKATLPARRENVWTSIKTAPERDKLVRFFAAGIVADNPDKFGLKRDQPLSGLYPR